MTSLHTYGMAEFRRVGHERVNVFEVDEMNLFKHYFDSEECLTN